MVLEYKIDDVELRFLSVESPAWCGTPVVTPSFWAAFQNSGTLSSKADARHNRYKRVWNSITVRGGEVRHNGQEGW